MDGENIIPGGGTAPATSAGSAGVQSQIPGAPTTVSALAGATGGIDNGNMVEVDIDTELFKFKSDDTPLMQLALKCKKVKVNSPEVEHFMIDEARSSFVTTTAVAAGSTQAALPLDSNDQNLPHEYGTLLVKGVDGYTEDGSKKTPGKDLMLFVTGKDPVSGNPIVRAMNGPKTNTTDDVCKMVAIPAGTTIVILSNACYETQKVVSPDLITPQPTRVYCQKKVMNQVISDYFEAQKKHIPFSKALIAEAAITNFKLRNNRSFWAGRKFKTVVDTPNGMGQQLVYGAEGIRWQFKKELQHPGAWTIEDVIALTKLAFTGEDVPKSVVLLAGKNLLESIQKIDYSKHPEIHISVQPNPVVGWKVTTFQTIFGTIEIKHEPTLDRLGWSNSGALIAPDRLVRYTYAAEHSATDRIDGEEASREAIIIWDALCLKGSCHIWIDGEGETSGEGVTTYAMWNAETAPTGDNLSDGMVYYLLKDCPGINANAKAGELWQAKVTGTGQTATTTWSEFTGIIAIDD